ncbi:MAG: hypothetical protein KDA41_05065, partial [Planctomycetales bacterium]|nr:hypothetical protein [Planctomycetales bacterium]
IAACKAELMPSWWLRRLPGGAYLHMARLLGSRGISRRISHYIGHDCLLEQLPKPLFITATDIVSGELVVQDRGCAVTALMASMCLPGLARPIAGEDRILVDGGVLNNLPGEVLRARGADIVIGVDISGDGASHGRAKSPGLLKTLSRCWDLMHTHRREAERASCDVVIRPQMKSAGFTSFTQVDPFADAGSAAAEAALPIVQRLIDDFATAADTDGALPSSVAYYAEI